MKKKTPPTHGLLIVARYKEVMHSVVISHVYSVDELLTNAVTCNL